MKRKLLIMSISGLSFLISNKLSAQVPVADFTISQPTTCVGSVIQITDQSSDAPTAWSYTVESMTGTLTAQSPTLMFAGAGDFDITLVATNVNGPSVPVTKNVIVNALPVITVAQPTAAICAGKEATLSASGAATYTWSNGTSNTDTFVPTATADYTVTGTDANSCKNSAVQSITVNALPVLSITGNTAVCAGSAITQTVAGADTYSWSTGVSGDNISETPTANTTYSVTGTFTLTGCSNIASKLIAVNVLPTVTVNDGTVCAGTTFTINASGAATYTYSSVNNTVIPTANTTYTVEGKSLEGCSASAVAISSVTVNALPVLSANSGSICAGSSFSITPAGAATYTFVNGGTSVSPIATTAYSVNGTDANGCVAASPAISNVTVNALPVVTVNSGSICAGSVFTITPAGATTFTFVNGANTVTPSANATYSVHGTDALGCQSSGFAVSTVSVYATPVITANSGTICAGDEFTITPNGASVYAISGGTAVVTPAATTSYTINGTSVNGCASAVPAIVTVSVTQNPTITVSGVGVICNGSSTTLTASGANTIVWLVGPGVLSNTIAVNPTATTIYSLGGITDDGCVGVALVQVTVNALPTVTVALVTETVCTGVTTTITSGGATSYSWNSGESTAAIVITPTANVTYTVTGTANGCSKNVTVTQNVDACVGIAKQTSNFETALYPNPTKGSVTIKVTQSTTVKIINIIGQTVYTSELTEGENTVSLNNQVDGIYFVQLKQGSQVKTVRVVKN